MLHPQHYILLHELALRSPLGRAHPHALPSAHIHTLKLILQSNSRARTPSLACTTNLSPGALPPRLVITCISATRMRGRPRTHAPSNPILTHPPQVSRWLTGRSANKRSYRSVMLDAGRTLPRQLVAQHHAARQKRQVTENDDDDTTHPRPRVRHWARMRPLSKRQRVKAPITQPWSGKE
jgi:hypothetical protein